MVGRTLHRHILPISLTSIFVICGWLVVGSPVLFVFIIGDAFETSELLKFVFYAIRIGLTISILIAFPLSLLFEKAFAKSKVAIVFVSGFLFLVSVFVLLSKIFSVSYGYNPHAWTGQLLLLSFSLAVFWFPKLTRQHFDEVEIQHKKLVTNSYSGDKDGKRI